MGNDKIVGESIIALLERDIIDSNNWVRYLFRRFSESEMEEIRTFCEICDNGHLGIRDCPAEESQFRYVQRGFCGYSRIDGVHTWTTPTKVKIDGRDYDRKNIEGITREIAKEKETPYYKKRFGELRENGFVPEESILIKLGKVK